MINLITLKGVDKVFQEGREQFTALKNIDLNIKSGEFFVFVGPSGCGKSTLLRIMSGLEESFTGELILDESISASDISFVFQQFALLPWLSVFENIALGLRARHVSPKDIKERVGRELKEFHLEKFADSKPRDLSGGMRQRVGIARALVTNPKIIFMDEPFSELDSFTAEELRKEILRVWEARKQTIIMVTHIVEDAIELADRIAVMTPQPGKIEKIIESHLPRPRAKRSVEFYNMADELYKLIRP